MRLTCMEIAVICGQYAPQMRKDREVLDPRRKTEGSVLIPIKDIRLVTSDLNCDLGVRSRRSRSIIGTVNAC